MRSKTPVRNKEKEGYLQVDDLACAHLHNASVIVYKSAAAAAAVACLDTACLTL